MGAGKQKTAIRPKDKLLSKISLFFFDRQVLNAFLWLSLTIFGILSYGALMKREGFPSVNIPLVVVNGVYFANDASKVDSDVVVPIMEAIKDRGDASSVQSSGGANFFAVTVNFKEGVNSKQAAEDLKSSLESSGILPPTANVNYSVPYFGATGGDVDKIDMAISLYDKTGSASTDELMQKAGLFSSKLAEEKLSFVDTAFVKNPYEKTINPLDGSTVEVLRSFDRFGDRHSGQTEYHDSIIVGVSAVNGSDVIKLDDQVRTAMGKILAQEEFKDYDAKVSASFAPSINEQISELQKSLLEGLLAVLIVGSVVITIRASLITVISMVTVVAITLGFLHIIGYTLNVITLFSLILALALMVDDTIIMVEAIDAARHKTKDRRKAVSEAARKVSRAMVAATMTAALSFAPLLFVSGMLGTFIRAIPITVMSSLFISLIVALVFIPIFAKYILLGKNQMGKKVDSNSAAGFEDKIARFITKPMIWARHSTSKLFAVGSVAVFIGVGFFAAGLSIARDVQFNIFPPSKDTNAISVTLVMPEGSDTEKAREYAARADDIVAVTVGGDFEYASYYGSGSGQSATQSIELTPYSKREATASQIADRVESALAQQGMYASVEQVDIGPPASNFVVQIKAENRQEALRLSDDIAGFMNSTKLVRSNGTEARFENPTASSADQIIRNAKGAVVTVSAGFDADDTSALVGIAENLIKDEFDSDRLSGYGLSSDDVSVDLGQESENQDSFKALIIAFPALLAVMYVLLAVQFKSLLQPLLIYLAIPFSVFGIALGLKLTDNSFSFFAMLGFFALLGLSVKNTILLTDYANQARQHGHGVVDSVVEALRERFRPLFATSVTAVVSLIPLALTSPFWEGLMVVLIFGLISSTILVVTVFPYYYLGAEFIRSRVNTYRFYIWFIVSALVALLSYRLFGAPAAWLAVLACVLIIPFQKYYQNILTK